MEKSRKEAQKEMAERQERISQNLENIEHTIVVMSGKGGVGKSTVAANLATELKEQKNEVGLLDCDLHGPNVPQIVGIDYDKKPKESDSSIKPISTEFGLKVISLGSMLPEKDSPVVWRGPMKMKAIQQFLGDVEWGNLDYLVLDLPPGTGDEPLSIAQLIPNADGAIIVTTPQKVALQTIRRSVNFSKEVDLSVLGLVENMSGFVCPNCNEETDIFNSGGGKDLSDELDIPFLGKIPLDEKIVESGESGKPVVLGEENKASKSFKNIVSEMKKIMNRNSTTPGDDK